MPFCFAPCLTGFNSEPAVAASIHLYESYKQLSLFMDKMDILDIYHLRLSFFCFPLLAKSSARRCFTTELTRRIKNITIAGFITESPTNSVPCEVLIQIKDFGSINTTKAYVVNLSKSPYRYIRRIGRKKFNLYVALTGESKISNEDDINQIS